MDTIADYEAWKSKRQQGNVAAAGIVLDTINVKPDEVAGDIQLATEYAKTTGKPVPPLSLVTENRSIFQQQIERKKNSTLLSSSPMLADWLRKPDNAAVARDDLEGLSWFEGFGRGVAGAGKRSIERLGQAGNQAALEQTAGRAQDRKSTFGEILESERDTIKTSGGDEKAWVNLSDLIGASGRWIDAKYADLIGADDQAAAEQFGANLKAGRERLAAIPKSEIATTFETEAFAGEGGLGEAVANFSSAFARNPLGGLSWALETAGESAPQMAAALTAALATRNPAIGIGVMGAGSYGTERFTAPAEFLDEKGIDLGKPEDIQRLIADPDLMKEAANRGVVRGLVIGAFDMVSGGLAGRALVGNPMVEALAQGVQQMIFGASGEYAARVAAGQEIDWNEILAEGFAELATTPVDMGVAGRKFVSDRRAARDAEARETTIKELAEGSTASILRARMPDAFRDFVAKATENGPVENVYVPASEFVEYFQGLSIDPFALTDELDGVTSDDLRTALATGGDLQIPTATYAAKMAGSDHDAFLMENMRFDPDAMTAREAKIFNERAADAMQEAFEEAERMRQDDEQYRALEAQIYDDMVSRLRVAGRSTDVATSEAMLYPAFYRVMAERSGLTTEEFLGRYPLPEVRGEVPQGLQLKNVDALTRTLAEARAQKAVGIDTRQSLLEFIAAYGGINDRGGELKARDAEVVAGRGRKKLRLARGGVAAGVRDMFGGSGGKKFGPDDVAQAAIDAGFMADDGVVAAYREALETGSQIPDIGAALWEAIDRELAGAKEFSRDQVKSEAIETDEALERIEQYLSGLGVSLDDDDATVRAAIEADQADEGRRYGQGDPANLIVQHNLSAANLIHADKMRGLAVPSLAISNVDYPLDGFGEITLLGASDLIDPRKDSASKVFDADVYSPRYPTVRYKIAKPAMNKVWKRLGDVSTELGHVLSGELDNGEVERKGLEAFRDSSAVQLEFLRSTGRDVALPQQTARTDYLAMVPELRDMPVDSYGMNHEPAVKAAVERAIELQIQRVHDAAPDIPIDELRDQYYLRGEIRRSVIEDIDQEKRVLREPGVNRYAARQVLRDAVAPHADEFAMWVKNQFGDVIASETIQTETASGDWKYLPHTLDNVVKVLRKKLRDGEGFNYGVGSIRSTVANQFKSVSAIQKARGRLIPADDMKALKDEVSDEFVALAGKLGDYSDFSKGIGWLDTLSEQLKEMAERGPRSLKQYFNDLPDELAQEAGAFLQRLANMPTEYFEAKLQRAVDISEFKAAVVPVGTKKEVLDVLKYARVPVLEYDPKVTGSRAAMIRRASGEGGLLFQSGGPGPRGSIQFPGAGIGNGQTIISLFKSADLSTFIHETGHYFLSVMQDLSARGEIASGEDFQAVKNWWHSNASDVAKDAMRVMPDVTIAPEDVIAAIELGSTGDVMKDAAINVGMQEQFARAFEAYLLEGKSPSIELRSAFEKFRAWLISIYRKIAGLNVEISDELRAVFDRMLATDQEIETARQDTADRGPVFAAAEEMGLSPEDYQAFLRLNDQARDEAAAKLLAETMAPIRRETEKWFKDERAKVREEVEQDINSQRVYRAWEWMGNRRWLGEDQPENLPDIRLSKDILVDRYGAGVLKTLPRGRFPLYAVEGGLDPDDAAGMFGFASGDELVKSLEQSPARKQAIEDQTDRLMFERHGDPLRDGSVEAAAMDAVHGDKRAQALATELRAMVEIAGSDRGLTHKEAREIARQTLTRTKVRDAINANRFLAAERKAGEEAQRLAAAVTRTGLWMAAARRRVSVKARAAVRADDASAAVSVPAQVERANESTGRHNENVAKLVEAKRRQLLNHALYSEARRIADEVEKAERLVAKLEKSTRKIRSERKRLGETSIAGDYVEAIEAIIYGYEFRKVSGAKVDRRAALVAYIEQMTADGRANELAIPQSVLDDARVVNYRSLTVEHLRGVIDSLKNIEHVARERGRMLINDRKIAFEEATKTVADAIKENVKSRPQHWVKDDRATTKARDMISGYISTLQSSTTILRQLDGREDMGPAYETLKSDMDAAAYTEREMRKEATEKILELYSVYTPDEQRRMAVQMVVPELGGQSFSRWNLIAMALNMGNEGNLARLTNKNARMHLTPEQVEAVKGLLDERDAKFVQSVWDYINSFRPKIAERDRRIRGVEPTWVDPAPVEIGGVTLRGGYYPIKYEGRLGGARFSAGDSDADILNSMMSSGYSSAQTKNGHLKARGEHIKQSLTLDVSVIAQHVNEVVHDLAFSEPVVNTWRILTSGEVEQAMLGAGLDDQYKMLKLWVQDAASGQVSAGSKLAKVVSFGRSGFTYSKLALNLKTILLQPLGLMQSAVIVGKKNLAHQMMRYVSDPVAMTNDVLARSRMMWERRDTFNKDLMDAVAKSNIASPTAGKIRTAMDQYVIPFGMAGITYTQFYAVDVPTWAAAFQKGVKQFGGDELKAAQFADMTVQRSQGSGIWSDRSGIERGTLSTGMRQNPFVMLLTTLGSYFFAKMNLIIERTQGLRAEPLSVGAAVSYALDMTLLLAGEAAVLALLEEAFDDDDDDDDEMGIAATIAVEAGKTFLAGLPGFRDAAGLAQGFQAGTYAAILDTFWAPVKQASQGEVDKTLVKSVVNLTGMLTRLPASQANRIIDGAWREMEGEDVSMIEYMLGRKR